jgi:hypothetical protein
LRYGGTVSQRLIFATLPAESRPAAAAASTFATTADGFERLADTVIKDSGILYHFSVATEIANRFQAESTTTTHRLRGNGANRVSKIMLPQNPSVIFPSFSTACGFIRANPLNLRYPRSLASTRGSGAKCVAPSLKPGWRACKRESDRPRMRWRKVGGESEFLRIPLHPGTKYEGVCGL